MGKVMSMVSRKVNRFNVEARAHRVLERDKPVPAPKFESNLRDMDRALEVDPELVEKLNTKDSVLDTRLKNVYVTSKESFIDYGVKNKDSEGRPLPLERSPPEDFEFGFQEPKRVKPGHCTLRQATQFINDHQSNPEVWTAKKIADEYKLKEENVVNVLKHFRSFEVYIPDKGQKERILSHSVPKQLAKGKEDST